MIETFPLERAAEAFEKMMSATVRFRCGPDDGCLSRIDAEASR